MLQKLELLLEQANTLLSEQQKEALLTYVALLNKWNQTYNLTAVRAPEQMLIRHILDSLVVLPFLSGKRFIDVGTGAGLPGIPLAIAAPEAHFTLLDSLGKRISFLQQVKTRLQLTNITLIHSRAETYRPPLGFEGIISRAFTSLTKMLLWCQALAAPDSHFYALKGTLPQQELAEIPNQFKLLKIIALKVPALIEQRHLVILKCTTHQPEQHCQ